MTSTFLDSSSFFPVLNFLEKRTYLQDLKEACSTEIFLEIWKRTLVSEGCFTNDEKSAFAMELDLPFKDTNADSTELVKP